MSESSFVPKSNLSKDNIPEVTNNPTLSKDSSPIASMRICLYTPLRFWKETAGRVKVSSVYIFADDKLDQMKLKLNTLNQKRTGMYNFFSKVEWPIKSCIRELLDRIGTFNCVAGSSFELNDSEDRTHYIINTMLAAEKDITLLC